MSEKKRKQNLRTNQLETASKRFSDERNVDESHKKWFMSVAGKIGLLLIGVVAIIAVGFWWQGATLVKNEQPVLETAGSENTQKKVSGNAVAASEVMSKIATANHWSGANQNKVRLTWRHAGEHFRHEVSENVSSFFRGGVEDAQIQQTELTAIEKILAESGFSLASEYLDVIDEGRGFQIKIYSDGESLFGVGEKKDAQQGDSLCVLNLGKVGDWQAREQAQTERWQRSELATVLESVTENWVVVTDKTDVAWQSSASARIAYGLKEVEPSGGVYAAASQEALSATVMTLQQQLASHGWTLDQERAWLDESCEQDWQTSWYTNGKEIVALRVGKRGDVPVVRVEAVATWAQLTQAEIDEKEASVLLTELKGVASGKVTILQARQMRTVGDLSRYLVQYSQGCNQRAFAYYAMERDEKTLIYSGLETLSAAECAKLQASDQMLREDSDFLVGQFCH